MGAYKLKGHEKFHLREGWINKGIKGVRANNRLFTGIDGPDQLGVGTNMVKSIRYWMQSFKLISESAKDGVILTELGSLIEEYDIYLEDDFSLWLLHSNIAKNNIRSTTWYLFFNCCHADEFKKEDLFNVLKKELVSYAENDSFPDNSLKDDIDILLNMYCKLSDVDDPEDKIKSPLAGLGLLRKEKDVYYRQQPDLRKFSDMVIMYELSCLFGSDESVSIENISRIAKNIYHLSRVSLNGILDRLDNMGYIKVDRTAGLDVVYLLKNTNPMQVIKDYYESR